jgi:hypothetical protein
MGHTPFEKSVMGTPENRVSGTSPGTANRVPWAIIGEFLSERPVFSPEIRVLPVKLLDF